MASRYSNFCSQFSVGSSCRAIIQQEMVRVFLVNPDHGMGLVENLTVDANNLDFYGTTTWWCPSLNRVVNQKRNVTVPLSELNSINSFFRYRNVPLLGSYLGNITSLSIPQQSLSIDTSCGVNHVSFRRGTLLWWIDRLNCDSSSQKEEHSTRKFNRLKCCYYWQFQYITLWKANCECFR